MIYLSNGRFRPSASDRLWKSWNVICQFFKGQQTTCYPKSIELYGLKWLTRIGYENANLLNPFPLWINFLSFYVIRLSNEKAVFNFFLPPSYIEPFVKQK